jgi:hypothetical protein
MAVDVRHVVVLLHYNSKNEVLYMPAFAEGLKHTGVKALPF